MKTKQITDLSLRTFANETDADAWLVQYAPGDAAGNELVFNGLRYNNKENGSHYEAEWGGVSWAWIIVPDFDPGDIVIPESVAGGANLFIIDSQGLSGALAEPTYDADILVIDATATVVTSIKVDPREDTIDPNVQIEIQTDSGKEYVSDYFILDATNEDSSTGGLPVLYTIPKTSMEFVGNSPINDRRFNGIGNFSSKPGGVEVTQIRISGNGGFSLLIPIERALPVVSPFSADAFTIESSGGGNHTHVRGSQTYSIDFHFNLTSLMPGNVAQTDGNFPTVITLSGEGVNGTYNFTIPNGDRPTGGDFGSDTDFAVTVTGIPAATSGTDDNADADIIVKNAENVESTLQALSSLGEDIPLDNTLITISGGVLTYPVINDTGMFGNLTQKALRTFDVPARVGNINFTLELYGETVGTTGSAYQITTQTGFSTSNSGVNAISGSSDVPGQIDVTGIPTTGVATVSNAYIITVVKAKNNSVTVKNVSVRYQQNDVAITNGGVYESRTSYNRDYVFNQEVLSALIENTATAAVVPNGVLSSVNTTTKRRTVSINQYTTARQNYDYDIYAVGEAGEVLTNAEAEAADPNNSLVSAQGFANILFNVIVDHIVAAGTHNGVVVPFGSYELNLQDPSYVTSPQIPGAGSTLTVTNPGNLTATIASNPGVLEIYSNPGSQWIYVRNVAGTQSDVINIEETV